MRKLVITFLGVSVLAIGMSTTVNGAPAANRPTEASSALLSAETVDDVAVPLDVLLSIQTQYQGFAVTHADKVVRDGKQAYRLRVDQNDVANDGDAFYVLYDSSWKLLGEEKIAQPAKKPEAKKSEEPQKPEEKPRVEQKKPDTETNTPKPEAAQDTTQQQSTSDTTQPTANTNDGSTPQDQQAPPTTTDSGTTGN